MRDRTCDTVADLAAAPDAVVRWALVTEFQTGPDSEILDRLFEYMARLRRELRCGPHRRDKFQVVAAVVNLTGAPQGDTLEMALPGLASPIVRIQAVTRTMREEDAALTLDRIAAGEVSRCLLSWISLMRGGAEPGIIEKWKGVANQEPNDQHRATYGALVTLFAELTDCAALWKSGLEGWNMRESTIVAEWKAEGRAEGIAQAKRSDLLELLSEKFGSPIASDLAATIERQTDIDVLSRWFRSAIHAATLDDFRAELAG
jgi:hypothetical protein